MANKGLPEEEMITIDKIDFINFLHEHYVSIRDLGEMEEIGRNEKTIRRYLNDGQMPKWLYKTIVRCVSPYRKVIDAENEIVTLYCKTYGVTIEQAKLAHQEAIKFLRRIKTIKEDN